MHAGSPVLEVYQEHSAIPAECPPLCQSGNPLAAASSLGMGVGSTGMIPRLNNSLRNGRAQDPQKEGEAELQGDQEHAYRVF